MPNFYVPYEPDYELIARLPPERIEEVRVKHQLAPGRRRLIFCARMIRVKRPDLVIDAFNAIADQRPEWDLVMVGEGQLRQEMMRLENEPNLLVTDCGQLRFVELAEILSVQPDMAGGRLVKRADDIEQRALAGTGWPDDRHRFTGRDVEGEFA